MAVSSNFGLNFGHSASSLAESVVLEELRQLRGLGVTKVRLAMPDFRTTSLALYKARVVSALGMGYYVSWGCTAGSPLSMTQWNQFKSFVISNLVPWAQSLNNPNFQLSIGNEEELHVDGTTLVKQDIINDVTGSYGNSVKAGYTIGPISYETAATERVPYRTANTGVGSLDKIGFNIYYGYNPALGGFQGAVTDLTTSFSGKAYISEWSSAGGFPDASTASPNNPEDNWSANIKQRLNIVNSSNLPHYYFSHRDGGFGLPSNVWAVKKTDNSYRRAYWTLLGIREPVTT